MILRVGCVAALTAAMIAGSVSGQTHRGGAIKSDDTVFNPPGAIVGDRALTWVGDFSAPSEVVNGETPELNLRFTISALPDNRDFVIELTNAFGTVYDTIHGENLTVGDVYWSLTVPASVAEVSVYGAAALEGLAFEVDRVAFPVPGGALESIFGENNLIGVDKYDGEHADLVASVESAVGRVTFFVGDARDYCTAFRIGPDILQTSRHCVPDDATCTDAKILFGYKKNVFNATLRGQEVHCVEVAAADAEDAADTVLLRVVPQPRSEYAIVAFRDTDPTADEPLFVIQHPGGGAKQLSISGCGRKDDALTEAETQAFGHTCDTKGGSSGAPVFSLDGLVVGQQRAGHGNPDITDKLNLATFGTLLASVEVAETTPFGVAAPATAPGSASSMDGATPLPLPTAPEGTGAGTVDGSAGGPTVASPGSSGDGGVAPDTGN